MPQKVRKTYPVENLSCASCAASVQSMLKSQQGVIEASVNFVSKTASVEFEKEKVSPSELKKAVQSIGYDLIVDEGVSEEELEEKRKVEFEKLKKKTLGAFVLSIPIVIFGMFFHDWQAGNYISFFLSVPVLFYFGRIFFINAFWLLKHFQANMDTLVAMSTGIAFLFSSFNTFFPEVLERQGLEAHVYFEAASVIIAFILLGRLLEEKAKVKTSSAIQKLMELQPKFVKVRRGGIETQIKIEEVKKDDLLIIHPGEKVPVDGRVEQGASYVNESMISGEPLPLLKTKGSKVFAGTINREGSLTIVAEKLGSETLLGQIIRMVKEAQSSKAPVQKLADKVAGIFVPSVLVIALITFLAWIISDGNQLTQALLSSVTALIIACPCALGLATPTAISVGVGKGAEMGILIKNAESLEVAYKVNAVVLDKTGTITEGKPIVSELHWLEGLSKEEKEFYSQVLYSIESRSEHPFAGAVTEYLRRYHFIPIEKFESVTGKGVRTVYNGKEYYAGTLLFLEENKVMLCADLDQKAKELSSEGMTVIHFAESNRHLAILSIEDKIKDSSPKAIKDLKKMGVEVYMFTGDNEQTARAVAGKTGIENFNANVLPHEKVSLIKKLQEQGKMVAMAGDGINDSQALAQADVGIAMAKGTDIAMEVAGITLMNSDLQHICQALRLSKATMVTIRQNLFWAFIYNVIGIPIAAGVLFPFTGFLLNPMLAGAAMALSSVSVVLNSLRLRVKLKAKG